LAKSKCIQTRMGTNVPQYVIILPFWNVYKHYQILLKYKQTDQDCIFINTITIR